MLSNDVFQRLLYDLFCLWHGVQRHYDPPITDTEEQRLAKVKTMICKLLGEIDARVQRIKQNVSQEERGQDFYEEWTMLTWNVLCITSRLQSSSSQFEVTVSNEDRVIYSRLNQALVDLVNYSREFLPFRGDLQDQEYLNLKDKFSVTMHALHTLYRAMNQGHFQNHRSIEEFHHNLRCFGDEMLIPCIDEFKSYCNKQSNKLWQSVRQAQISRMKDLQTSPDDAISRLVAFYSEMMYVLAVLGARLQGFRYDLMINKKVFGSFDPVQHQSEVVFSALELLMADCVLSTEPSTNAILVTNNLFSMNCGALARGVVFKDFEIQVVSEETAEHIQGEMARQRMMQQPSPIGLAPSAALLAMKPTSGTKRSNAASNSDPSNTAHKKSDVNSKESVTIYPKYNFKNRYWAAMYPHLLCTTRQKGRQSTHNSYQDLSPTAQIDKSNGKRPIFYFHIKATMFSPSGRFASAHTLSLPFTIATRRNQDCQVQRMMSSYTATIFWLYGCNQQDGLLLQWVDTGMGWEHFKHLYKQHFKVNADVQRALMDEDFDLLQYKLQCPDCASGDGARVNGVQQIVTFKNVLCPHLRYECGSTNVRFSVWRGMLELLQIFHDTRNNVKKLWEIGLLLGFLEFSDVDKKLERHKSALIMRLSFVTGGTICFTVKSTAHTLDSQSTRPIHLEPLDLKKLQTKCLKDYLRDIADAEKVKYIVNSSDEVVRISDVLMQLGDSRVSNGEIESRDISSNVTHSGDIDSMQHIKFTAMRIAVVTCKVKPPSADLLEVDVERQSSRPSALLPSLQDDFVRELVQLANFHGKSRQEAIDSLEMLSDDYFATMGSAATTPATIRSTYFNNLPPTTPPISNLIHHSSLSPNPSMQSLPSPTSNYTPSYEFNTQSHSFSKEVKY
ncbi:unnamed protein product [Auanema sp. JU1783]|nr:unnamed protein product [Auanema sp. JU1783]